MKKELFEKVSAFILSPHPSLRLRVVGLAKREKLTAGAH